MTDPCGSGDPEAVKRAFGPGESEIEALESLRHMFLVQGWAPEWIRRIEVIEAALAHERTLSRKWAEQADKMERERDEAFNEVKNITDACFEFASQIGKLKQTLTAIAHDDRCGQHHDSMAMAVLKEVGPLPDYSKYERLAE